MKIGLFGGTFSPPHRGHVRAAKSFISAIKLDKLIVMPTCIPPHKELDSYATAANRLEMAHIAFDAFAQVSDYEINRGGASYTVTTLQYLRDMSAVGDEIYFLVGEDMFLSLDTWKKPDVIFGLCTVVCTMRDNINQNEIKNYKAMYEKKYNAKIIALNDEPYPVSSSDIRKMCADGKDIWDKVPPRVLEYIKKEGLYGIKN